MGLELLEVAFGPFQLGLVLAGVDPEENVVGLDQVAVFEVDLGHVARNAGGHLDRDDGLGIARELLVVGDRLRRRQLVKDRGRLLFLPIGLGIPATCRRRACQEGASIRSTEVARFMADCAFLR